MTVFLHALIFVNPNKSNPDLDSKSSVNSAICNPIHIFIFEKKKQNKESQPNKQKQVWLTWPARINAMLDMSARI